MVATRTQADVTAGNACWETPPAVFAKLAEDFGPFDVDLTADADRALCDRWLGPGSPWGEDALAGGWYRLGECGYSNPPYGRFVPKILPVAVAQAEHGFESVFLLPLRVTRSWFLPHVIRAGASHLLFCDRRITFFEGGQPRRTASGAPAPAMFDSVVVRFARRNDMFGLSVGTWEVPPHV